MFRPRAAQTAPQESSHARGHSETNLSTTADSNKLQPSRSMSALASFSATRYDADENYSPSANGNSRSASGFYQPKLDSLREGDNNYRQSYYSSDSDYESPAGLGISTPKRVTKMSSMEDFNSAYPMEKPPSRAQSQLQVRDLKDQAAGLRTKVALLKVKTQEDNLRRRSLQSLRTPSPFTAAEQWYTSAMEHQQGSPNISNNAGYGWVPEHSTEQENCQDLVAEEEERHHAESFANGAAAERARIDHRAPDYDFDIGDDTQSMYSTYEDAEEGDYDEEIDREALDRILNEPFDDEEDEFQDFPSDSAPEATPHEEREDAFDYENFYLHSALGTYSQSMRRRSYGSTGSTETTRPSQEKGMKHGRNGSGDSVSTLATFATATENVYSDYEDDDDEGGQHEIDQALGWDEDEDGKQNTC